MLDESFKDPVQECNECQMLPVEYALALISQNEPSGYPMLSLVIYVYHSTPRASSICPQFPGAPV